MRIAALIVLIMVSGSLAQTPHKPADSTPKSTKVEIPSAGYTFPELAELLSKSGTRVVCARSLRNHAAVVHLKPREFSSALAILSTGLDLQFRPSDEAGKSFVMEPSKIVSAREKPWLMHLAGEICNRNNEALEEFGDLSTVTHGWVIDKMIALSSQLKLAEETDPDQMLPATVKINEELLKWSELGPPGGWFAHVIRRSISRANILDAIYSDQPFATTDAQKLMDINALRRLHDQTKSESDAEFLKQKMLGEPVGKEFIEEMDRQLNSLLNPGPAAYHRLRFSAESHSIDIQTVTIGNGVPEVNSNVSIGPIPDSKLDEADNQEYLGKDFLEWRKKRMDLTEASIKLLPQTPIPIHDRGLTTNTSQIVQRWAEITGREVVMEIYPGRELVTLPSQSHVARNGKVTAAVHSVTFKDTFANTDWDVNIQDEVTLIQGKWACLDRHRDWPFASMFQLAKRRTPDDPSNPTSVNVTLFDAIAFHKSISDYDNVRLMEINTFWNVKTASICQARCVMIALAELTASERNRALGAISGAKQINFELSRFSGDALQRMASALRELVLSQSYSEGDDEVVLPEFVGRLAKMHLFLSPRNDHHGPYFSAGIEGIDPRTGMNKTYGISNLTDFR